MSRRRHTHVHDILRQKPDIYLGEMFIVRINSRTEAEETKRMSKLTHWFNVTLPQPLPEGPSHAKDRRTQGRHRMNFH